MIPIALQSEGTGKSERGMNFIFHYSLLTIHF